MWGDRKIINSFAYGEDTPEARKAMHSSVFLMQAEEEGMEIPDEPPWHSKWSGGRDCTQVSEDEYVPVDSWSFHKITGPSFDLSSTMDMQLRIVGKRRNGKLVPCSFSVHLTLWGKSLRVELKSNKRGRPGVYYCNSVAEALRRADRLPLEEPKRQLLAMVFSHDTYVHDATCVYRIESGDHGPVIVPWMTKLRGDPLSSEWPPGKYLEIGWFNDYRQKRWRRTERETDVSLYGCSGGTIRDEKLAEIAKTLECWIREPEIQKQNTDASEAKA